MRHLALPLLALAAPAAAQQVPVYHASPEPVVVEATNPHLMYLLAGNDTVGRPVEPVTIERQRWSEEDGRLVVIVEQETLRPGRSVTTDTLRLDPDGRVVAVDGKAPGLHVRIDFVPRLPAAPLSIGTRWTDTLHVRGDGPAGEHVYEVVREHRAVRMLDTLGASVIEIASRGEVHYRDGWWADATETARTWIDVRGPVVERAGYDPARGRLVYRSWWMDLRGMGGAPGPNGEIQLPAGLRSASHQRVVDEKREAVVRRDPEAALRDPVVSP
jgi:hypothetical protein